MHPWPWLLISIQYLHPKWVRTAKYQHLFNFLLFYFLYFLICWFSLIVTNDTVQIIDCIQLKSHYYSHQYMRWTFFFTFFFSSFTLQIFTENKTDLRNETHAWIQMIRRYHLNTITISEVIFVLSKLFSISCNTIRLYWFIFIFHNVSSVFYNVDVSILLNFITREHFWFGFVLIWLIEWHDAFRSRCHWKVNCLEIDSQRNHIHTKK